MVPRQAPFRVPRRAAALAAALVLGAALAAAGAAPTALAHAGLVESTPADGAVLASLPTTVSLVFSETVSPPAYVAVTTPSGGNLARGDSTIAGSVVRQDLAPSNQDGAYSMSYRVVSEDGHPVTGTVRFRVGEDPDSTQVAGTGDADSSAGAGVLEARGVVLLALGLVVIGAIVAVRIATAHRARRSDP